MSKQLSKGTYSATQSDGEVEIRATGVDPTSGYKHFFERSILTVFPPQFAFFVEPPSGMVMQVFTPFSEMATFHAIESVKEVKIYDRDGWQTVPVVSEDGGGGPYFMPAEAGVATKSAGQKKKLSVPEGFSERSCRKVVIGKHGSIPEFKTVWKGSPIKIPYFYCRTSSMVVYAEFCGPEDVLGQTWNDIVSCAVAAGGAATIVAIVASPAAALPAFSLAFKTCLAAKIGAQVNQISASLSVHQEANGDWHRC